jgi:hypothetical protein
LPTLVQNPPAANGIINPKSIVILDCLLWVDGLFWEGSAAGLFTVFVFQMRLLRLKLKVKIGNIELQGSISPTFYGQLLRH